MVTIYNSIGDANSWRADIPASIEAARVCFKMLIGESFALPIQDNIERIRTASVQWTYMNWLGSLLGLAGVLVSFKGLDAYHKMRPLVM